MSKVPEVKTVSGNTPEVDPTQNDISKEETIASSNVENEHPEITAYNPKNNYGTLLEFGPAPYQFKEKKSPQEKDSYYIKIKEAESGAEKVIWGVDLERNINEKNLKEGIFIQNEFLGKRKVSVPKFTNKEGEQTPEYIEVERNTFETLTLSPENYKKLKQEFDNKVKVSKEEKTTSSKVNAQENKNNSQNIDANTTAIPLEIQGIELTSAQQIKLANREPILLKGMTDNNGIKKDGHVELIFDEQGNTSAEIKYTSNTQLVIGDKIMKYRLSKDDKQKLEKGETLGPLELDKNFKAFLQVDKNQNKVIVRTDNEIGIPNKIGEYKLTDLDKNKLANGLEMLPRIYKGKHGYFMAQVKLTQEGNGLEYSQIVGLSNSEAKQMLSSINTKGYSDTITVDDIANITNEAQKSVSIETKKQDKVSEKTQPQQVLKSEYTLHQELKSAIVNGDVQSVSEILSKGFSATEEHTDLIKTIEKGGSSVSKEISALIKNSTINELEQQVKI